MKSALYKNGEFVKELDVGDSQFIICPRKCKSSNKLIFDEYKQKNFPFLPERDSLGRMIYEYLQPFEEEISA